jgi:transposase
MRPFGTSEQLARRRQRARGLLRRGQNPKQVAYRVGATERSVRRWQAESKHPTKPGSRKRAPGRPCRLNPSQCRRLLADLEQGAFEYGYVDDYWTLDRIAHVIWELFQVRYRSASVWYLLQRLDWSCQKPQRRALHRDDEAIAHWKHYIWPHIKKVAATRRNPRFSR